MTAGWLLLAAAVVSDVLATFLLQASHGFRQPVPVVLAVVTFALTIWVYGLAITRLAPPVAYAVFGATGTLLVAVIGLVVGSQPRNWATFVGVALIVGGVTVLPLAEHL